ncbi:MAG: DNA mismatch repair endonuclease MutL [Clostridia bacterium]|nr:DNA mismatch repair endonuclease MutL [Clostridia bacterium]
MGKINLLSFEVANLIAAGEVVDRPASAVKELLENAIDSGADKITVEIKNGGTSFIRIADNGCGIEFDDLPTALLRHATSKIKEASDLDSISTLGFRGEALAAISSVSKIRILSKTQNSDLGAMLEAHAGQVLTHINAGCQEGTTVIVEDLFYNVPARKKFLKRDATEASYITSIVEKVAMSRPDISFKYIIDGDLKFITSGDNNTQNAIYAILGADVAKKTIKVSRASDGIKVEGFISAPNLNRSNRNLEIFYINSRYIRCGVMVKALEQAFESYIPSDKFPVCVINVEIDPLYVDVNVHPSKLEVKFSNEQVIFDAIYYAVRTALATSIERPMLFNEAKESIANTPFKALDREAPKNEKIVFDTNGNIGTENKNKTISYIFNEPKTEKQSPPTKITKIELPSDDDFVPDFLRKYDTSSTLKVSSSFSPIIPNENKEEKIEPKIDTEKAEIITEAKEEIIEEPKKQKIVPDYKIIGEAFNSYVIAELGDILYLIDKHAAHERIIFEDLKKKISESNPSSQMLLIPIEVSLASEEIASLNEYKQEINKTGFGFTLNGNIALIDEIPSEIDVGAGADAFFTLVSKLTDGKEATKSRYEVFEKALYQSSCKAAIKAGRIYDNEHIKWIVERTLTLDNIKYCPHGRPVAFEITKHFLEKEFERIK